MLIKGIRSFSPENVDAIEFHRPLTLIVGENGAGKTTIIECLKMACTGDLPPNARSGQTFVHDPKVAGETEVKAQIKLRFLTPTARKPVVCVRNLRLVQKASKMEYKALEGLIQTWNEKTDKPEALSHRCADMDKAVPALMGVSKAVLDSVIFVHQDEANWPLSDPSTLKKKFDEIFSATRYTKALEALRKLKLEHNQKSKEMVLMLQTIESHKTHAEKLMASVTEDKHQSQSIEGEIRELEALIVEKEKKVQDLQGKMNRIKEYAIEISNLEARIEVTSNQCSVFATKLQDKLLDESTEQLQSFQLQHMANMRQLEEDKSNLLEQMHSLSLDEEALREQFNRETKQQGKLMAEADAHAKNVKKAQALMRSIKAAHSDLLPDLDSNEESTTEFMASCQRLLASMKSELLNLKEQHRIEEDECQVQVGNIAKQIALLEESKRSKEGSLAECNTRHVEIEKELETLTCSQTNIAELEAREAASRLALVEKKEHLNADDMDSELQTVSSNIEKSRSCISSLRRERESLATLSTHLSRLQFKEEERGLKIEKRNTLLSKHEEELLQLLGLDCYKGIDSIAEKSQATHEILAREKTAHLEQLQSLQQSRGIFQGRLDAACQALSSIEDEIKKCQEALANASKLAQPTGAPEFEQLLALAEEEKRMPQQEVSKLEAMSTVYQTFATEASEHHRCPVCHHQFSGGEESLFCDRVQKLTSTFPDAINEQREKLYKAEQQVSTFKKLKPVWTRLELLTEQELPEKASLVKMLQADVQRIDSSLEAATAESAFVEHKLQQLLKLNDHAVVPITGLTHDISLIDLEIATIKQSCNITDESKSLYEVDKEIEKTEADCFALEKRKEILTKVISAKRSEIFSMENAWRTLQEEIFKARRMQENVLSLQHEREQMIESQDTLQLQVKTVRAQLEPLYHQQNELVAKRAELRESFTQQEECVTAKYHGFQRELETLDGIQQLLAEYTEQGRAEKLARTLKALSRTRELQQDHANSMESCRNAIQDVEAQMSKLQTRKANIDDNLQYRMIQNTLQKFQSEMQELSLQRDTIADAACLEKTAECESKELSLLRDKQQMLKGSLSTYAQQIVSKEKELRAKEYRDVHGRHRTATIELETNKMAVQDLERYYVALDKALLTFHRSRMEEVNKIIRELWQKTYRNQDIDYVQIKADTENAKSGSTRSYNYRVVMRSGDAELDMRGRCSAGQKVLACLIIRLALAEVFCLNCGILALDEPTTNLDPANSQSLAQSLHQLMEQRRNQDSFQLIVITHDEQFAHMIGKREHAETYYRISKDEYQHSKIREQLVDGS